MPLHRLAKFLRSVIPADPWQLVFLLGVVFLFVSPRLSWLSEELIRMSDHPMSFRSGYSQKFVLWLYPVSFAGLAGYFICFWPGKTPIRRILGYIALPALVGLGFLSGRILALLTRSRSVLESPDRVSRTIGWSPSILGKLTPGLYLCATGLFLIFLFVFRVARGKSSLPLTLPAESVLGMNDSDTWERTKFLIWAFVGPLSFLYALVIGLSFLILMTVGPQTSVFISSPWYARIDSLLQALVLVAFAAVIVGKEQWKLAGRWLRLPEPRFALLGLLIPLGIFVSIPLGAYLSDRISWAFHHNGKLGSPEFISYFLDLPGAKLLWMGLPALAEEIVFRGILQSSLIRRYGLFAGAFLTSMTWTASHFRTDVYSRLSVALIVLHLLTRIVFCLGLGFVLSWITLRSRSIWPAAVTHTVSNILATAEFGSQSKWSNDVRLLLWAALAAVLFQFWPVSDKADPLPDSSQPF